MTRKVWNIILIIVLIGYGYLAHADWDQSNTRVLTIEVFQGKVLDIGKNVGTIFIADPQIVDFHVKEPGILYLYSKKLGTTSLYVTNKKGEVSFKYLIHVTHNLSELKTLLRTVLTDSNISVLSVGESVVLRGSVRSAAQAQDARTLAEKYIGDPAKVLMFLHVTAPTQVNLRVQVMEMSRDVIRALGIDWTAGFKANNTQFTVHPLLIPTDFTIANPSSAVLFTGNLLKRGNFLIQSTIAVLEQNGFVTVLSEPNLTALSGETASFLVGGEFPIPVPQGTTGTFTIMFKKFGVSLAFTPTILENGKINLQVRPEVSQLSQQGSVDINGFKIPALSTRRAQTTVELKSGQSFAIAGLLQNNASQLIKQLPGLGDVPILGRLFRSERFNRQETELVIVVTPYIVQPAGNQAFEYPADNVNASMTASYTTPSKRQNVGFILD